MVHKYKGLLLSHKSWNNAICTNIKVPGDCCTGWSKSGIKTNIKWCCLLWTLKNGKTYFFNLKLIYKTVTDVENKLMVTREERMWGINWKIKIDIYTLLLLLLLLLWSRFSRVRLCATPWTAAHQAPLSTELSRQEYWNGLPFPSPIYALPWVKQLVRSCYITQEPSLVLCDDLEEWERGGEKSSRGRGYSIIMAELNCYTAESNTTLESNFPTS